MDGENPLRMVLFDVDGTLADSDPIHFEVFRTLLLEHGVNGGRPIDEEFFKRNISGRSNAAITADFFPGFSVRERERFSARKEGMYRERAKDSLRQIEGLQRFLDACRARGVRMAAVTNAPRANAELMLAALNLEVGAGAVFETLVIGDECARPKPAPDPYLTALERMGVDPASTSGRAGAVVVEDSASGVAAGVAAGLRVVGITTTLSDGELRAAGASMTIGDYDDGGLWGLIGGGLTTASNTETTTAEAAPAPPAAR